MELKNLPDEILLHILQGLPIATLFRSIRFLSRKYNHYVHQLFTSPHYIMTVLRDYDPCFKLQRAGSGVPESARPDLFMRASLMLPWPSPRDLRAVKMKLVGKPGDLEDRVIVWIDGNYQPVTSHAMTWIDDASTARTMDKMQPVSTSSSVDSLVDGANPNHATAADIVEEVETEEEEARVQERKKQLGRECERTGWYEGTIDWWCLFKALSQAKPRDSGNYGTHPAHTFLAFTRLSEFDRWSKNPVQLLMGQELGRAVESDRNPIP